jgi:holo-[acyl-carrier protein] synthase
MIEGIGIDVVDVSRFKATLERTPAVANRLFTERELVGHRYLGSSLASGERALVSLAGKFAAKEALYKALHVDGSVRHALSFHEAEIFNEPNGRPAFLFYGALATLLSGTKVHLSISHDGAIATAFVVIERH